MAGFKDLPRNLREPIPKGWHTAREIAMEMGLSVVHTKRLAEMWVAQKLVERRDHPNPNGGGRIAIYRPK